MTTSSPGGEWPPPKEEAGGGTFQWGANNIGSAAGTSYLPRGFFNGVVSPGPLYTFLATRDGTLKNLFVHTNSNAGNGQVVTYRLQINGAAPLPTDLLVPLATGMGGDASNTVTEIDVLQGDRIDFRLDKPAAIGSGGVQVSANCDFV